MLIFTINNRLLVVHLHCLSAGTNLYWRFILPPLLINIVSLLSWMFAISIFWSIFRSIQSYFQLVHNSMTTQHYVIPDFSFKLRPTVLPGLKICHVKPKTWNSILILIRNCIDRNHFWRLGCESFVWRARVRFLVWPAIWFGTESLAWFCKLSQSRLSSKWVPGETWRREAGKVCESTGWLGVTKWRSAPPVRTLRV
jgi:hypothetical protein